MEKYKQRLFLKRNVVDKQTVIITLPAIGCHFLSLLTTVDVSRTQAIFGTMSSSPKKARYTAEDVLHIANTK